MHAHHEEFRRLPDAVGWEQLAAQLRAYQVHVDLGEYDPTLPRRTPEERVACKRRLRELMPDYERAFHLN